MPAFQTSTGAVQVETWGYQLQGPDGRPIDADRLAWATHDLIVTDFSRDGSDARQFTPDEITRMKDGPGGRSAVAAYLSIGEAGDYRDFWQESWTTNGRASGRLTPEAPDWLGPLNPDWPESRKVRYWDPDWQAILFNDQRTGMLDTIVGQEFDAAYLDIVDAYYFWGEEVAASQRRPGDPRGEHEAALRMVDLIVELTRHARETNPDFFVIPQNGAFIIDALGSRQSVRKEAYLDAIGAIAVEDVYFRGGQDVNNRFAPDQEVIDVLQRDFLANGKAVFSVDYVNTEAKVELFHERAIADGFIPFAAPDRDLDQLVGTFEGTPAYVRPTAGADQLRGSMLADELFGLGGDDQLIGREGDDLLEGGGGRDRILGGSGRDTLLGQGGDDVLDGGLGRDRLTGGTGSTSADGFVFSNALGPANVDKVTDFQGAYDQIFLDDKLFQGLGSGSAGGTAISPDGFFLIGGPEPHDPEDRILYDRSTGDLFYDADGSLTGVDPVLFASLSKLPGTARFPVVAATDFELI